ncbi:Putative transcription regulator (DUF1323) [Raoultella terrigena]|uniref:Transcription regulator (DUF1323) n=1 Tax=Raoultella terrigena TaxID=577 RepID=A0A4U9D3F8_RAOTE|nr:Putative transcription regulator (DUF1323) [Raoultella terrigena]
MMMKLKDKMTPAELAECLGLARQTINRWVREQKWRTEAIPGVKGGRARLIVIDRPVLDFLANIPALRHLIADYQLAEPPGHYFINDARSYLATNCRDASSHDAGRTAAFAGLSCKRGHQRIFIASGN